MKRLRTIGTQQTLATITIRESNADGPAPHHGRRAARELDSVTGQTDMKRTLGSLLILTLLAPTAAGEDVILVDDDFESYTNDSTMFAQWGPGGTNARLATSANNPDAFPSGGQGADHIGGAVLESAEFSSPIFPSETQSIVIRGDVYDDGEGNKRMSIGLRGSGTNFLELGFYNTDSCDPTVCSLDDIDAPQNAVPSTPGFYEGTGYGYRLQLYPTPEPPLLHVPDWQFFQLPEELDREEDADELVNIGDVGPGWHQYQATIAPDSITLEIDLFRDGVQNASTTPGDGTPGVDASVTWNVESAPAGYESLRIGGPSGLSSLGGGLVYDNLFLALVNVEGDGVPGDYNGNGLVDAADYTVWRDHLGQEYQLPNEDPDNADGMVTQADYEFWKANFGSGGGAGALSSAVVPEPTTGMLVLVGTLALALGRCSLERSYYSQTV